MTLTKPISGTILCPSMWAQIKEKVREMYVEYARDYNKNVQGQRIETANPFRYKMILSNGSQVLALVETHHKDDFAIMVKASLKSSEIEVEKFDKAVWKKNFAQVSRMHWDWDWDIK